MKFKEMLVGISFALLAAGCSTVSVSSDYDHKADFSALKTYSWSPKAQPKTGDPRIDGNALLDMRVRKAVDSELAAKGYQQVSTGSPDFWIGYQAAIQQKVDTMTLSNYYGYGPTDHFNTSSWNHDTFTTTYDQGTLVIDIADPKTNQPLWRGSAEGTVSDDLPSEKREQRINDAVQKILLKFPPQK